MKKILLTIGLAAIATLAHGQGTIAFGNSALTRITICDRNGLRNATAADNLIIGVFFGPAGTPADALTQAQGTATIGTTAGVMVNAPSVFALPGTEPGQVVSLQIWAWDRAGLVDRVLSRTGVRQVTLAPTAGPGTVIWQTATGTNPNRFHPMLLGAFRPECIPEPSMLTFMALGGLCLLLFRRKSTGQ